jgi:hypothetical protein
LDPVKSVARKLGASVATVWDAHTHPAVSVGVLGPHSCSGTGSVGFPPPPQRGLLASLTQRALWVQKHRRGEILYVSAFHCSGCENTQLCSYRLACEWRTLVAYSIDCSVCELVTRDQMTEQCLRLCLVQPVSSWKGLCATICSACEKNVSTFIMRM